MTLKDILLDGLIKSLITILVAYTRVVRTARRTRQVIIRKASPYHCTRCSRPLRHDHDYCPRCHYATVEPRNAGDLG